MQGIKIKFWRRTDMFADYHVHTEFSDDSVYPMEQIVKDAAAMHQNIWEHI